MNTIPFLAHYATERKSPDFGITIKYDEEQDMNRITSDLSLASGQVDKSISDPLYINSPLFYLTETLTEVKLEKPDFRRYEPAIISSLYPNYFPHWFPSKQNQQPL